MTTYVYRNGELVDKNTARPIVETSGKSFYYNSDQMDHTWHPASGKYFDSKSEFRKETKAYGCQEIGDEKGYGKVRNFTVKLDKRQRIDDIKRSIYEIRNGRRP
jgi:hypothetical protein